MNKRIIHLLSGTHWDREWRHTPEQSKLRLAALMDNILDVLENKPEYETFCVDGGTIVLEDYFTIRPENRERVKKLIEAGRLSLVGWYTLPETNTVAPESMIRNLLLGRQMAKEYGGCMHSGYTATSYGQPSQLPQLYRGFGLENAIFYRGTNKHILTPLFDWVAPDGSTISTLRTFDEVTRTNWFFYVHGPAVLGKGLKDLTYTYDPKHLPVHMADMGSYEKAFTVLQEDFDYIHDEKVQKAALDHLLDQAEPYKIGNNILAMNMEDNDEPYRSLPELIADMNRIYPDVEIVQTSLDKYMDTICNVPGYERARHQGELRYTTMEYNNFNALLGAVYSSRVKLKLLNDDVENNLIHLAEPMSSYAYALGGEYPGTNIARAWRHLLQNHTHDSICGAAVDRAHEDALYNFSISKTVAEECTNKGVISVLSHIDSLSAYKPTDHTLTLFNTLPYAREEVIELVVDTPKGASAAADIGVGGAPTMGDFYDIIDSEGSKVEYVELSQEDISIGVERQMDTKAIKFKANRKHILVKARLPQNGYVTYAVRMRAPELACHPEIMENRPLIARDCGVLENKYLKVTLHPNGTFDMLDKQTGRLMEGLHYFTDTGEVGSAHISNVPKRNTVYTSLGANANITMLESNTLRGKFRVELSMMLPAAATIDGNDRTREMKELSISYILTLEKDSRYLKVHTKLHNEHRDHKLTVNFPTGVANADFAACESAWDVAKRTIRWRDHKDNYEAFVCCQPMQNFLDVSDGEVGCALLAKGLREYEVCDDNRRTIKLTLLRTHRAYMTANGSMNVEELDKYTGQHSFGTLEYDYAIYPHSGDWQAADAMAAAYAFKVPVKAVQGVPLKGGLPVNGSLLKISNEKQIMTSALKLAENGKDLVLRVWNIGGETLPLTVETLLPVTGVQHVRLDETVLESLPFGNGKFSAELGPHKIETFLLQLGEQL